MDQTRDMDETPYRAKVEARRPRLVHMSLRSSALPVFLTFAFAVIATQAKADLFAHECKASRTAGDGAVAAAVLVSLKSVEDYPDLSWGLAEQRAGLARTKLFIRFARPALGAPPTVPIEASLDAFVSVTPAGRTDVVFSIGEITVRQPFYSPRGRDPSWAASGFGARVSVNDAAFLRALTSAGTVHVAFQEAGGVVLAETDLDLAARPQALEALDSAWREVKALVPNARNQCSEVTIEE